MKGIRRKEKAIENINEMKAIIKQAQYITIACCKNNEPYLITVTHGYDSEKNCLYFHCAKEGKKIDILKENNVIWGQAMQDNGYAQGECDHLYATTQFRGKVTFIENFEEKKKALIDMIYKLDQNPTEVIQKQITKESVTRVTIGRIDIDYMSGKHSKTVIVSM
ncbi:MAG: pyridoxamine 5'-phosphate oxidase family protein [Candidatus Heimdallarchaeota archaeon]|nr:pyridoxamine 5'-phosphate oxidase family protein [Candidatus Heimdallarchaeota archaeon]